MKKLTCISLILFSVFQLQAQSDSIAPKIPFDGIDMTWQNGSDRRDSSNFSW